ncbi:AlbA family DNA-binding domain-containing protein [Streptomyces cellulosae]|uniref:Helix-turn-helix domain-containing protein n=1 Tax=Streptomyces cellulosae TaxID=1968 RepID=A0ABW7XYX7_STRCE
MSYVEGIQRERTSKLSSYGKLLLSNGVALPYETNRVDFTIEWNPEVEGDVPSVELTEEVAGLVGCDVAIYFSGSSEKQPGVHVYSSPGKDSEVFLTVRLHEAFPDREVEEYVSHFLRRRRVAVEECFRYSDGDGVQWNLTCRGIGGESRTMRFLFDAALALQQSTMRSIQVQLESAEDALEALKGNEVWRFIGLHENEWLEVKSQLPDLSKSAGKFTLVKDVAQFANSRLGGILVYGMFTKNKGDGDAIRRVVPFSLDERLKNSIEATLRNQVYPAIANLHVDSVSIDGGDLLYVYVPPQSDSAKPFIVEGAGIAELGKGSVFAVPIRSGGAAVQVTGKSLHALLAGRISLSG